MANYTKTTDFAAKDTLPGGDTNKVVRGAEFETEFDAISTAIATKTDTASPTFTGTVTIPTADINGGNIDGTVIGASAAAAGTFTNLVVTSADINGGTVDGATIGGSSAGAGTFTNLTASGTVNFSGATVSNLGTITTANLDGGTVDNAVIGGATPAAGTFTNLTANTSFTSGNVDINGGAIDGTVIGASSAAAGTFTAIAGTTGTFSGAVTGSNLNVSNWDTAFGWGNHASAGYLTSVAFANIDAGAVTLSSETFSNVNDQIPTNAAVVSYVAATIPTISEVNDLSTVVTWATVPDAFISASSVNQHVSVDKATQTKTYTSGETSTITLSSAITSGVPVVSVTKEIPQTGVSNNNWDVDSTAENYTRYNYATATTLDFVAGDIDGASYSSVSFSVTAQETKPSGVTFNSDGTKMFIVGESADAVIEYSLSTAYNVSTSAFVQSFDASSQDLTLQDITFNSSGTKMFVVGSDNDSVYEYALSTGFDVSTASYTQSFSVTSQETFPTGIAFNSDGTKMFIVGGSGDDVNEYTLSTGFDVSTASFVDSFSVASEETVPRAVSFNSDGTKMFIVGTTNDTVFQYNLSTAFDVSTASYSSLSFSVASQENAPVGMYILNEKLFISGEQTASVHEYSIGYGSFALGTGSFASADVGKTIEANGGTFVLTSTGGAFTQTSAPTSYDQVASGSWEMYGVVYNATDGDLELSGVTTNTFDVSTAVYSQSFSVSSQEALPSGIAFNTDGTKMFITGEGGVDVNEYTLSTGFDVSTASFVDSFSVSSQELEPTGIAFNSDGTKMFISGNSGNDINEYTLSTGFDVSTASFVDSFSVSSQDTNPQEVEFNADGTKMFVLGTGGDAVYEYSLSTGFDVSTASYTDSFSVASQETSPFGLAFNSDGTKMYVSGASENISEYTLTTGFDVSTASYSQNFSVSSQDSGPRGIAFNTNGTKIFVVGSTGDAVYEYSIGTAAIPTGYHAAHTTTSTDSTYWIDINSMTADEAAGDGNIYYCVSTDDRTTWKIAKSTDGERSIVRNNSGTWQYNSNGTYGSETWVNATTNAELPAIQQAMEISSLTSGFDLASGSYIQAFSVSSQESNPTGLAFNTDGTKMFVLGDSGNDVNEYTLSTGFDVSTASFVDSFSVSSQETDPSGIAFNTDGTKMFIVGQAGDDVNEYSLSTGFDVSTASFTDSASISSEDNAPKGLAFNNDGTKMYVVGGQNKSVYQYALTTGFDVSTKGSVVNTFSVNAQDTNPRDVEFNSDGTKMYIPGGEGQDINEYTLSTAYDISTASFSQSFDVSGQESFPCDISFNSTGTKMFVLGNSGDDVIEYHLNVNQKDKTQLDAVPDANHFTLANDLDLAIIFEMDSGTTVPSSDGVSINYDANALNQGAVLGTDYNWDFPATDKVRITSLAAQNLKVRIV